MEGPPREKSTFSTCQATNSALKRLEREGLVAAQYGGVLVKKLAELKTYDG